MEGWDLQEVGRVCDNSSESDEGNVQRTLARNRCSHGEAVEFGRGRWSEGSDPGGLEALWKAGG